MRRSVADRLYTARNAPLGPGQKSGLSRGALIHEPQERFRARGG
jgi:hypothetical protein